ncbi:MAG TPA: EAL domain-containing protein [Acidimicrobiales bacterium]|nr:EAL domain-containing protein [Acidimicrobiales bacterium]
MAGSGVGIRSPGPTRTRLCPGRGPVRRPARRPALFVNASPSTISDPAFLALRDDLPDRLVLELTEQEAVEDDDDLRGRLAGWLGRGFRLAVDDAGAGYSSLRHIVELSPDYLKLDRELIRGIDEDPNRRALMRAVVAFAREVGTSVIAEGVETRGELDVLRDADVHLVQGYLLARPAPPWPQVARTGPSTHLSADATDDRGRHRAWVHEDKLRQALARLDNVVAVCDLVVETLLRRGHLMSSLYLERNGELRCVSQRGLWQVHRDGGPPSRRPARAHRHQSGQYPLATRRPRVGRHLRPSDQPPTAPAGSPPCPGYGRDGLGLSGVR